MASSDELHRLVDALPEGALESAYRMLEHIQVWPPPRPPGRERMEEIRRRQQEHFRSSMRSGTVGGYGGGASYSPPGHGHSSSTHWDDQTAVIQTWHYHKGYELNIVEKFRLESDDRTLVYIHEVTGPKDATHRHEMTFDLA